MKEVVIGFSGGLDSTTLLGFYLEQGYRVHCCFFSYGSKHELYEMEAIKNILTYYAERDCDITINQFDLKSTFSYFKSNLLKSGGDIPDGNYTDSIMEQTIVPGRNMIMASIMAGFAESIGVDLVALGVHSGDAHIYPDCRIVFIKQLNLTVSLSTDYKVSIIAPFIYYKKHQILQMSLDFKIPVPYHLTRTCYKDQPVACGKCGACQERLEAFKSIKLKDPIAYEK
jgi:7-cyano-7-deazaguanine synthase